MGWRGEVRRARAERRGRREAEARIGERRKRRRAMEAAEVVERAAMEEERRLEGGVVPPIWEMGVLEWVGWGRGHVCWGGREERVVGWEKCGRCVGGVWVHGLVGVEIEDAAGSDLDLRRWPVEMRTMMRWPGREKELRPYWRARQRTWQTAPRWWRADVRPVRGER